MDAEDLKERKQMQDMLRELFLVVIGDEAKGIEGMMHRQKQTLAEIAEINEKLKTDHELLWWNRTVDGIWTIIKRPILYLITFAVIAAVMGGTGLKSALDYVTMKLGIK